MNLVPYNKEHPLDFEERGAIGELKVEMLLFFFF